MDDRVRIPDVAQKLIAQPFALAGTFYQTGNIHDFDGIRQYPLGLYQFGQFAEPLVRHGDHPDIRFDGTKREVCRLRLRI